MIYYYFTDEVVKKLDRDKRSYETKKIGGKVNWKKKRCDWYNC